MRAIKTLGEETRRRAEQSMQLKTHTEHHSQRRLLSQQTESEALFQQKLDRLVKQKREQQRRDRQCQQRLDALAAQRQRVAAMLRVHIETNEKLNNQLVASSHPSTNTTVSDEEEEASKEVKASSRLNQNLNLQLVASFNKEVSKELGAALCRKTRWHRLWPEASSSQAIFSARSCLRPPQAPASLGQSAASVCAGRPYGYCFRHRRSAECTSPQRARRRPAMPRAARWGAV